MRADPSMRALLDIGGCSVARRAYISLYCRKADTPDDLMVPSAVMMTILPVTYPVDLLHDEFRYAAAHY